MLLAAAAGGTLLSPSRAFAFPGSSKAAGGESVSRFVFAQVAYSGGNWDPEPSAWAALRRELEGKTSIEARSERTVLSLDGEGLFSHPFLFIAGSGSFPPFGDRERSVLRTHLKSGGLLFADDCGGTPGHGFDASFRREMKALFPDREMHRLPSDHTVFRSFFLVRGMGGRRIVSPFLEGVTLGGRTPVVYSANGLSSAWATDPRGRWLREVEPGGERQRKLAFQLGVNIILYALCDDYKQDRIHLPFLRQKI